jgi:hypothetical protein
MMAKLFPEDPQSSAALPHNFVNPQGEEIGPADYFLNYSGLTGKNLEAALESAGLEAIKDVDGKMITGARSKPPLRHPKSYKKSGLLPNEDPEVLSFDCKRKIELERE